MAAMDEVTTSFDHHDHEVMVDPYPTYEALRKECPIAHTDAHGGYWVLSRYRDVYSADHDWQTFSAAEGMAIPSLISVGFPAQVPLECDPPDHTRYRNILNKRFTPPATAALEPQILELTTELIDSFIERGEADLAKELALPLPALVILRMLGLDGDDEPKIRAWLEPVVRHREDLGAAAMAGAELYGYLQGVLDGRREANDDRDDLIGVILAARPDGEPVEDDVMIRIIILLILGGLETTASVIATTFLHLIDHPETRDELVKAPELLPSAVEEFLRLIAPVQGLARTATRDVELSGVEISRGDRLFLSFASANRDEDEFPDAARCVLDRNPNRHLAFGSGIHRCLGSHLGRLEFRIALGEVLRRLPDFRLADGSEVEWGAGGEARGVSSLPVVFTPGPRLG